MSKTLNATRQQSSDQELNEGLAELELQKLQRQYRLMEGDRKAYGEESKALITKQRTSIDQLKEENRFLSGELKILEIRYDDSKRQGVFKQKADQMKEQAELYGKLLKYTTSEIQRLESVMTQLEKDITNERSKMGGIDTTKNNENVEKQIRVLENRLEKSLMKFSKALATNKQLRENIDSLRRERLVFDNIYRKFERELQEQKKQMAELIEMSNSSYEARDEAHAKIMTLRERAEKEYQAYLQEIKELDRALEQDRKLKDFMAAKMAERAPVHGESIESTGKDGHKKAKERVNFSSSEMLAETLSVYETAFTKIREVTGVSDVNELVSRFNSVEDQNFSLFNYVNEINNEIEKLSEEIVDIQRQIDQIREQNAVEEEERKKEMAVLEAKLNNANERFTQYEKQYSEIVEILADVRKGVSHVMSKIQNIINPPTLTSPIALADPTTSSSLESSRDINAPVVDANLLSCLGLIEHKTNDILLMNYLLNQNKRAIAAAIAADSENVKEIPTIHVGGLLGAGPTAPITSFVVQAPSTGDDYNSDEDASDEDDRPLTREELRMKTLKGLSKREKASANRPASSNPKVRRRVKA